jgi:hypothetical protein
MALTQKIYLGTHPVEKRYLGEHPIKIQLAEFGVIAQGLTFYFNSKLGANVTEWPATISDRTGSYVTAATYYNATEEVVELDGGAATTPSLSFGSWPYSGTPAAEHSVLIFTKPKRAATKQVMEFQGIVGGIEDRTTLELRNDVDSTNYFVWRNAGGGTTYYASEFGEVTLNDWHMFGYGFSGSAQTDVDLFFDTQTTPVTGSGASMDISSNFWEAGSEGGQTATDYSGSLAAVLVYDRKITAEEARLNYLILSSSFAE